MDRLSDTELMMLVQQGDFAAFDELYNRYSGPIRRFLFSLAWDKCVLDDYVQEVFLRLFRSKDRYVPSGKFSTYIFQIAKNYYLTQRRKQSHALKDTTVVQEDRDGRDPFTGIRINERIEPEAHLIGEYRKWQIHRAIESLPEGQRMVFVLSHFEGMKYTEIAEVLQVPVGTVKSRMSTAVRALRSLLEDNDDELRPG